MFYITIPLTHCCYFTRTKTVQRACQFGSTILAWHNLEVAQNTTFDEAKEKYRGVFEMIFIVFRYETTVYKCVDIFYNGRISMLDSRHYKRLISAAAKTSIS